MLKNFLTILCGLVILLSMEAQNEASSNTPFFKIHPDLEKKLHEANRQFIEKGLLSGSVAMIAHKNKIIYQKTFGMQSIEEGQSMQLNSLFRIASMTKPLTAVAMLLLVEEGEIGLDDPVQNYLSEAAGIKVLEKDGRLDAPRRPLTIRHLLMHTSGTRGRADPWFKENGIHPSKATSLEEYVSLLLKGPLVFHPGEGFNYAMNNDICARIIEVVSGHNFGDFLRERVLEPLEMNSTWFVIPEEELYRLSSIYGYRENQLVLVEAKEAVQSEFPRGNGQLVSSAGDYMNFLQMLQNGGVFKGKRLLKKSSIEEMISDQLPQFVPLKVGYTTFPDTGFGLSVAISRRTADPWTPLPVQFDNLFRHLPEGSYLWPGVTNTFFWVDPENEIIGLVFSQFTKPDLVGNFQVFTQTFYKSFLSQIEAEKKKSLDLLSGSMKKLHKLANGLSELQVRFKPAEDRWSIQNNVEHLIKVEDIVWDIIQEALKRSGEGLQSDISDEDLLATLSTRKEKYTAPSVLTSEEYMYKNIKEALKVLDSKRARTIDFLKTTEADLRSHFSKNPVFGNLDLYQWTLFASAHCLRHIEQVEEIMADDHFPKKNQ